MLLESEETLRRLLAGLDDIADAKPEIVAAYWATLKRIHDSEPVDEWRWYQPDLFYSC
jgi:hypothetical protein